MREKIDAYYKALEVVQLLGQSILRDSSYLPEDLVEPIEDIDISIHYILTEKE